MLASGNWLQQVGNYLNHLIVTRNLTFMLLVGIAILSISFFILTRTRWGQAKPVSKCIALSILAHLLLGGYAWSTRLMFSVPTIENNHPTSVSLVSDQPETIDTVASQKNPSELKPWQKFETGESPGNPTENIQRPRFTDQYKVEKPELIRQKLKVVQPETESQPVKITESRSVPAQSASHQITKSNAQSETIPIQRRQKTTDRSSLLSPNSKQPERLSTTNADIETKPLEQNRDANSIDINGHVERIVRDATRVADANRGKTNPIEQRIDQVRSETGQMRPLTQIENLPNKRFDGKAMPKIYRARSAEDRLDTVKNRGGSEQTEAAVKAALKWLAANQQQDGRWNPRHSGGGQDNRVFGHDRQGAGTNADTGLTGLAILSFLGAGHTQHKGPYQDHIDRGLKFLIAKQKQNGSLAGDARLFAQMYCHSMALFALSEAYAITGDRELEDAVKKGVAYSLRAQDSSGGGWRYRPGDAGDMSQFGWQVMALKAAKLGGIDVPDAAFDRMKIFLKRCSFGNFRGLAAYRPVERVSTTMTAEALVCRYFLNGKVNVQTADEAASYIGSTLPNAGEVNYYYWYYGTLAMFHTGGKPWRTWNNELSPILVRSQNQLGSAKGSWNPNGLWSGYGGRVYSTAMATLCLEVYYRYLTSMKN